MGLDLNKKMQTKKNVFFMFIALIVVLATIFQFVMYGQLSDHCTELSVNEAPLLSGLALTCSFLFNGLWLFSSGRCRKNQEKNDTLRRASLLFWTAVITAGVAASGAALGQIQLYSVACPSIQQSDADLFRGLQYASIVLLIISISFPHAYPAKNPASGESEMAESPDDDKSERELLNPYASKHNDLSF